MTKIKGSEFQDLIKKETGVTSGRVLAQRTVGCEFDPQLGPTKDLKKWYKLNRSHFREKVLEERPGTAFPCSSNLTLYTEVQRLANKR